MMVWPGPRGPGSGSQPHLKYLEEQVDLRIKIKSLCRRRETICPEEELTNSNNF